MLPTKKELEPGYQEGLTFVRNDVNTVLGEGSYGQVTLGCLENAERTEVAIKCLSKATEQNNREAFYKEYKALEKCNDCPNIVTVYGYLVCRDSMNSTSYYFAMERAVGSLSDNLKIRYQNGLPPDMTMTLICDSASALEKLHKENLHHLDLKCGNILIFNDERGIHSKFRFAFSDLGMIREKKNQTTLEQTALTMNTVKGTVQEMHPFLLDAWIKHIPKVESKTMLFELWAMGCVLYQVATGRKIVHGLPDDKVGDAHTWYKYSEMVRVDTGSIAYNAKDQKYITDVENDSYPKWLRYCIRELICILLKPVRSYEASKIYEKFAENLRHSSMVKVYLPQLGMVTSHAGMEEHTTITPLYPDFDTEVRSRVVGDNDWLVAYAKKVQPGSFIPHEPILEHMKRSFDVHSLIAPDKRTLLAFQRNYETKPHVEPLANNEGHHQMVTRSSNIVIRNNELEQCVKQIQETIVIEQSILNKAAMKGIQMIAQKIDNEINRLTTDDQLRDLLSVKELVENLGLQKQKLPSISAKCKALSKKCDDFEFKKEFELKPLKTHEAICNCKAPTKPGEHAEEQEKQEYLKKRAVFLKDIASLLNEDVKIFNENWKIYVAGWKGAQKLIEELAEFRYELELAVKDVSNYLRMAENPLYLVNVLYRKLLTANPTPGASPTQGPEYEKLRELIEKCRGTLKDIMVTGGQEQNLAAIGQNPSS